MWSTSSRPLAVDGAHERLQNVVRVVIDRVTCLEGEGASLGDDVERRSTRDRAAVEGDLRIADRPMLLLQIVERAHQSCGDRDRAWLGVRQAGMCCGGECTRFRTRACPCGCVAAASWSARRSRRPSGDNSSRSAITASAWRTPTQPISSSNDSAMCNGRRSSTLGNWVMAANHRGDEALHVGRAATVQLVADLVIEYGSVAQPVPAGTTSVWPDSISRPPRAAGRTKPGDSPCPRRRSNTITRPPLDSA